MFWLLLYRYEESNAILEYKATIVGVVESVNDFAILGLSVRGRNTMSQCQTKSPQLLPSLICIEECRIISGVISDSICVVGSLAHSGLLAIACTVAWLWLWVM